MKKYFKLLFLVLFIFLLSGCIKYNVQSEITDDLKFNLHYTYKLAKWQGNSCTLGLSDYVHNKTGYNTLEIDDGEFSGIEVYNNWDSINEVANDTELDIASLIKEFDVNDIDINNIDIGADKYFNIDGFFIENKENIKLFIKREYEDKTAYFSFLYYTPRLYGNRSDDFNNIEMHDIIYDPNDDMFCDSEFYFNIKLPSIVENVVSNANIDRENKLDLGWELSYKDLNLNMMYLYFEIPKEVERIEINKSLSELKNSNYKLSSLFTIDSSEKITWSSSDESIATIVEDEIKFLKTGEVYITGLGEKTYKLHLVITNEDIVNPETKKSLLIICLIIIFSVGIFMIDKIYRKEKRK